MHQSFAPKLSLDYMSPPAPVDPGYGKFDPTKYFENYRNEFISRIYVNIIQPFLYFMKYDYETKTNIISIKFLAYYISSNIELNLIVSIRNFVHKLLKLYSDMKNQ